MWFAEHPKSLVNPCHSGHRGVDQWEVREEPSTRCLTHAPRFASLHTMKTLLQTGAHGRVPVPREILRLFLVWLVALPFASHAGDASVTLGWTPPRVSESEPGLVGYQVHYGTVSRKTAPYAHVQDVGLETTATVSNLQPGETYFFAVTARNEVGRTSVYSDEISWTQDDGEAGGTQNPPGEETLPHGAWDRLFAVRVKPTQNVDVPFSSALGFHMVFRGPFQVGGLVTDCAMGDGFFVQLPWGPNQSVFLAVTFASSGELSWFIGLSWRGAGGEILIATGEVFVCTPGRGCVRTGAHLSGIRVAH